MQCIDHGLKLLVSIASNFTPLLFVLKLFWVAKIKEKAHNEVIDFFYLQERKHY